MKDNKDVGSKEEERLKNSLEKKKKPVFSRQQWHMPLILAQWK